MTRSTKKYTAESSYKDLFEDDYEDFGYEIANAKRYTTRNKSQRKFKDTDYYDDWQAKCATNWSVTLITPGFGCCGNVNIVALICAVYWTLPSHMCWIHKWDNILVYDHSLSQRWRFKNTWQQNF